MVNLADLLNDAEESLDILVGLHRELVRIPSVNTGVMPTGNESDVAEYAKSWLNQEQIQADILESAPGRGNLIAKLKGSSDVRTAEKLFYANQAGLKMKMIRITLKESRVRTEPGSLYYMNGKLEMHT